MEPGHEDREYPEMGLTAVSVILCLNGAWS